MQLRKLRGLALLSINVKIKMAYVIFVNLPSTAFERSTFTILSDPAPPLEGPDRTEDDASHAPSRACTDIRKRTPQKTLCATATVEHRADQAFALPF